MLTSIDDLKVIEVKERERDIARDGMNILTLARRNEFECGIQKRCDPLNCRGDSFAGTLNRRIAMRGQGVGDQ